MVTLSAVIGIAVILYIIWYYVDFWYFQWRMGSSSPLPAFPIVGHIPYFIWLGPKKGDRMLRSRSKEHAYPIKYAGFNMLACGDPELINEILVKEFPSFNSRGSYKIFPLVGPPLLHNLFTVDGKQWQRIRALCRPAFTSGKLKGIHSYLQRISQRIVTKHFAAVADTKATLDVANSMQHYTLNVIGSIALGIDLESMTPQQEQETINFMNTCINILGPTKPQNLFIAFVPHAMKFIKYFDKYYLPIENRNRIVRILRASLAQRREQGDTGKDKDLIQLLMDAKMNNTADMAVNAEDIGKSVSLDDEELMSQLFTFLIAGYETSATTLIWAIWAMTQYPHLYEILEAEILSVVPAEGPIPYDILPSLEYTDKWLKETMRIFPAAGRILRQAEEDITVRGHDFKKGDLILIPVSSVHMDPSLWPDPTQFDPSRFDSPPKTGSYMAFGAGPRHCIGMQLAIQEMKLVLATIIRDYKISAGFDTPMGRPDEVTTEVGYLQNAKNPVTCKVEWRR